MSEGEDDLELVIGDADAGARVDALAARLLAVSAREAARHVDEGGARVDGRKAKKGDRVRAGERLSVAALVPWLAPADAAWWLVMHEDDEVLVVDKPAGVACHPLARGEGGTLIDVAAFHRPEVATAGDDPREGGLVHRIDNLTSGLVCVAKTPAAFHALRAALAAGDVGRAYLAAVLGEVTEPLVLDGPIAHDPSDGRRMVVAREGVRHRGEPRVARSAVTPVSHGPDVTLVHVHLEGGRRHQIRAHLADAGHPLLGDELYGGPPLDERPGQALHAHELDLPGRPPLLSPLPQDLQRALERRGVALHPDG